jgi:hypothetical protein
MSRVLDDSSRRNLQAAASGALAVLACFLRLRSLPERFNQILEVLLHDTSGRQRVHPAYHTQCFLDCSNVTGLYGSAAHIDKGPVLLCQNSLARNWGDYIPTLGTAIIA